jgi:acyl-CoA thioester hydrolase
MADDDLLAGFPVEIEQTVAWGEMDFYRHVNNIVYFRYFENARIEYLGRLGWGAPEWAPGVGPILAAVSARFRRPLTFPDTVRIGTRLLRMDEDRFTLEHRVVSRAQNAVTTEGEGTVVTFDYARGEKVPVPEELRRRIAALEAGGAAP